MEKPNIVWSVIKPDIIIKYSDPNDFVTPVSVVYVRPKTNIVSYEKAIIKGVQPYAKVIYMANLNGKLFIKDALILDHYACQYRFAIFAKDEIAKYPEMVKEFEDHFQVKFKNAKIIGSFESLLTLGITPEELFNTFVDDKDFINFYGQTIKKIESCYIVNYDMPALLKKYNKKANIFVIAIRFLEPHYTFKEINRAILTEMKRDNAVEIIDEEKYKSMDWDEQIKRTYHFSSNHITAMFDMIDFVFRQDGEHITFHETPLGKLLLQNDVSLDKLKKLKEYPIVYVESDGKKRLVNIKDEAKHKSIDEIVDLVKRIK